MARQAIFEYPGFNDFKSATYTLAHGVQPGIISVRTPPQGTRLREVGTVKFTFDDVELELPQCRVVTPKLQRRPDMWTVKLVDRRWKWKYCHIHGRYNVRVPVTDAMVAEEIDPATEKTPQELAKLLLDAMGERRYNVSNLPNDTRPKVLWDYASAPLELQSLVDSLGCRVVLGWNNRVRIEVVGEGDQLPDERIISEAASYSFPTGPDDIMLVGAPIVHEVKFFLEAVGLDVDGQIKLINRLTYAPDGGWEADRLGETGPEPLGGGGFEGLAVPITDESQKILALARSSVGKWYRIKNIADADDFHAEGAPEGANERKHVLPLIDKTSDPDGLLEDGPVRPGKAYVQGSWYNPWAEGEYNAESRYPRDFSLDTATGIVKFSDALMIETKLASTGDAAWVPAHLYLTCMCAYSDPETNMKERYTKTRAVRGRNNNTEPLVFKAEDVKKVVVHDYVFRDPADPWFADLETPLFSSGEFTSNDDAVRTMADYYLDAKLQTFEQVTGGSVTLEGLQKIDPDGAIRQVTISTHGGPGGSAVTTVSRNDEHDIKTQSYAAVRQKEQAAQQQANKQKVGEWLLNMYDTVVNPGD